VDLASIAGILFTIMRQSVTADSAAFARGQHRSRRRFRGLITSSYRMKFTLYNMIPDIELTTCILCAFDTDDDA